MRNIRIYADCPLSVSSRVTLPEAAAHHLSRVLRCRRGDEVIVFNGQGGSFSGRIATVTRVAVEVELARFHPDEPGPALNIALGLGVSRSARMDYAVQKSVELGVSTIAPLFTERGIVKLAPQRLQTRLEHWRAIIVHACEQSGRNILPALEAPQPLSAWLRRGGDEAKFVLTPDARQRISALGGLDRPRVSLLIGPEGGLSPAEQALASEQGHLPLSLGPRTLRTETAVAAALAVFQAYWGDMR